MPLDGKDGESFVDKPLNHVVTGTADGNQSASRAVHSLMMSGIDHGARTIELVKEIAAAETCVIYGMELVMADPSVIFGGINVLEQIAAEMYIDELEPLADAEHRLFFCDETGQCLQLQDVQSSVHMEGAVIRLPKEERSDIPASGEDKVGRESGGFRVGRGNVGNVHSLQSSLIVLGIRFAA